MEAMLDELGQLIEERVHWEHLGLRVQQALGDPRVYERMIRDYSIDRRLRYRDSLLADLGLMPEAMFYDELVKESKRRLRLFPYEFSDYIIRTLRISPFAYYTDMMLNVMRAEMAYDRIPNFTAADGVRLLGIGRNQFIDIMNKCRGRKWIWKGSKGGFREQLPNQPLAIKLRHWWTVHPAYIQVPESVGSASDAERNTYEFLYRSGESCFCGELDYDVLVQLHRQGLVYFEVPIDDHDCVYMPPLQNFVMNRNNLSDSLEKLLYDVFVSIDGRSTAAQLATMLDVPLWRIKVTLSLYCRLGFAEKVINDTDPMLQRKVHLSPMKPQIQNPMNPMNSGQSNSINALSSSSDGGGSGGGALSFLNGATTTSATSSSLSTPVSASPSSMPPIQPGESLVSRLLSIVHPSWGDHVEEAGIARLVESSAAIRRRERSVVASTMSMAASGSIGGSDSQQSQSSMRRDSSSSLTGGDRDRDLFRTLSANNVANSSGGSSKSDSDSFLDSVFGSSTGGDGKNSSSSDDRSGISSFPATSSSSDGQTVSSTSTSSSSSVSIPRTAASLASAKRIGFMFDSSLTAFLMMGNLTYGLKAHAVTLFEGGKLTDQFLDSFLAELDKVDFDTDEQEGEARRYFEHALTLRDTLRFLRYNSALGESLYLPVDLVRCEAMDSLDPATRLRILDNNYTLLICMAPLTPSALQLPGYVPRFYGPAMPEFNSPWFRLFLYTKANLGPPSLFLPKGSSLTHLPEIFHRYERLCISAFDHESEPTRSSSALETVNDALLRSPVLVQAFGEVYDPLTREIPFPVVFPEDLPKQPSPQNQQQSATNQTSSSTAQADTTAHWWHDDPALVQLVRRIRDECRLSCSAGFLRVIRFARADLTNDQNPGLPYDPFGADVCDTQGELDTLPRGADADEPSFHRYTATANDKYCWVPLEFHFGVPLFSEELNHAVCGAIVSQRLFADATLDSHNGLMRALCRDLVEMIDGHIGARSAFVREDSFGASSKIMHPTHVIYFDGHNIVDLN